MTDNIFKPDENEKKAPNSVEELEAFLEEQVGIEDDIEEEPALAEDDDVISIEKIEEPEEVNEEEVPPVWESRHDTFSNINMQVKKKKRRWVPIVIICAVVGYVAIAGLTLFGVFNALNDLNIEYNFGEGKFQFSGNNPPAHDEIEQHLQISQTPESKDDEVIPSGQPLTVKQISKKVRKSVVGVVAEGNMNISASSVGSGIIMSSDGYIITNNHVIENASKISVVTDDGVSYNAFVVGSDARTDLAVLKVDAQDLPAAEFGNSDMLEQGDMAVAIGNPAGIQLQNTVTSGIVSAINRNIVVEDDEMTLIQTDASINPGNSGGPLVNEYGQVIGINTIKIGISYYEGLGFAIPINTAKPIIDELISRGYITGRPSIGISGTTLTERDAAFYGLKAGMYVEFVHPYSDAFKKGLRAGDVIVKMEGQPMESAATIKEIRDEHVAGDEVEITVYRKGREFNIKVILMDEAELEQIGTPANSRR